MGLQDPKRGPGPAWGPLGSSTILWKVQLGVRGRSSSSSSAAHLLCDLGQVICWLWAAGFCPAWRRCQTVSLGTWAARRPGGQPWLSRLFLPRLRAVTHSSWNQNLRDARDPQGHAARPLLCLRLGQLTPQPLWAQSGPIYKTQGRGSPLSLVPQNTAPQLLQPDLMHPPCLDTLLSLF